MSEKGDCREDVAIYQMHDKYWGYCVTRNQPRQVRTNRRHHEEICRYLPSNGRIQVTSYRLHGSVGELDIDEFGKTFIVQMRLN